MSIYWDIPRAKKFILEKQKENKGLIDGMFGSTIKLYLLNKRQIAAARKLIRLYKTEHYQKKLKSLVKEEGKKR